MLVAVAALVLVAAPADAGKKTLKFPRDAALAVGRKVVTTHDSAATITMMGSTFTMNEHVEAAFEVLAVEDKRITRLRAAYGSVTKVENGTQTAQPRDHKTYVATWSGGAIAIAYEDGAAPTAEEIDKVRHDVDDYLGERDSRFRGRTFRRGRAVELTPDEIARAFHSDEQAKKMTAAMTWRARRGDVATFDLEASLEYDVGGSALVIDLDGEVEVSVKTLVELSGSMRGELRGTGQLAGASGSMQMTFSADVQ